MLLLLDWDETLSAHDTLALIAPPAGAQTRGPAFAAYGEAYMDDLQAHAAARSPPRDLDEHFESLAALDAVELASQARIEAGGLFEDADLAAMEARAREVALRDGWREASQWLAARGVEMHIISVGWSARFIAASLAHHGCARPASICANEVEADATTGRGTGRLTKSRDATSAGDGVAGIRTAPHKLREAQRIAQAWRQAGGQGKVVYAGDSTTDLQALLFADIGLVVGQAKGLEETLERLGGRGWLAHASRWTPQRKQREALTFDLVEIDDWRQGLAVLQTVLLHERMGEEIGYLPADVR